MDLASTLWLYYYPSTAAAVPPVGAGSNARRWRIGSTGTPAMRTLQQAYSPAYVPPVVDPGSGVGLGTGDLTTAVIAWMAARHFTGDVNTAIRDYLAAAYSSGVNEDLGTLVARLDDHNKES